MKMGLWKGLRRRGSRRRSCQLPAAVRRLRRSSAARSVSGASWQAAPATKRQRPPERMARMGMSTSSLSVPGGGGRAAERRMA